MNITTHGKDGPQINLLEAEKKLLRRVVPLLDQISKQGSFPAYATPAKNAVPHMLSLLAAVEGEGQEYREENSEEEQPQ